jgi:hypothetical protein
MPADIRARLEKVVRSLHPFAYCDRCLALASGMTIEEAQREAPALAVAAAAFTRQVRACYRCGETVEMTCLA